MLEVTASYDIYGADDAEVRRALGRRRWLGLAEALRRTALWSVRRDVRADPVLRALIAHYGAAECDEEDHPSPDAAADVDPSAYVSPERHYQRVACTAHLLVQLAAMPRPIVGDYEPWFVGRPRWAAGFMTDQCRFTPLQPDAWPHHPAVPPFIVRDCCYVCSPVPLEGARACRRGDGDGESARAFRFVAIPSFVAAGGWTILNPRRD